MNIIIMTKVLINDTTVLQTVCARKSWPNSKEVDLGPLRGEAMVGLNPVPYVEQDDTFSVLMSMDRNDFTH